LVARPRRLLRRRRDVLEVPHARRRHRSKRSWSHRPRPLEALAARRRLGAARRPRPQRRDQPRLRRGPLRPARRPRARRRRPGRRTRRRPRRGGGGGGGGGEGGPGAGAGGAADRLPAPISPVGLQTVLPPPEAPDLPTSGPARPPEPSPISIEGAPPPCRLAEI